MGVFATLFDAIMQFADYFADLTLSFGPFGIFFFLIIYVGITLFFLPITPFSLAAGAIYGWWGIPLAYTGAVGGAMVAFFLARGAGQEKVRRICEKRPIVRAIERVMVNGGFRLILLIRLSGALPFAVQNYSFGLSAVNWRHFFLASLIGLLPGAVIKVWIGKVGMDVLHGDTLIYKLQGIGLVMAIVITLVMVAYVGALAVKELKAVGILEADDAKEPV